MTESQLNQWPADKIVRKNVSNLVFYARNSRMHSDEQVNQLAASIKEWGWTVPVLIDPDGGLIAGHGRILAAQRLGITEVPCMIAEGWTEAQKKAQPIISARHCREMRHRDINSISLEIERIKPCVCRSACLNTMRRVRHNSIAKSEYTGCPPGVVRRGADHTARASSLIETVRSPRRRRLSSYSAQLVTRRFCFGILARRSALNLCGIYSILKKSDRSQYQWSGDPCNNAPVHDQSG